MCTTRTVASDDATSRVVTPSPGSTPADGTSCTAFLAGGASAGRDAGGRTVRDVIRTPATGT